MSASVMLAVTGAVALIAVVLGWTPLVAGVARLVRLRNAFLVRRGVAADFVWTPDNVPAGFREERLHAPGPIAADAIAALRDAGPGDWPRARALATWLVANAKDTGGIRADLSTTYREIRAGRGYCADFVRVYLAAAREAGLFCRQWAFSFDGFGAHGHTFVEVFDRQRRAWAMLDVYNNVYMSRQGSADPLDAIGLRKALIDAPATIEVRPIGPARVAWSRPEKLLDYYVRGTDEWYLWWGNDVVAREAGCLVRALSAVSGRLAHRLFISLVKAPPLVVWVTASNASRVDALVRLRRRALWMAALTVTVAGVDAMLLTAIGSRP